MADNGDQAPQDDATKVRHFIEASLTCHDDWFSHIFPHTCASHRQTWLESLSPDELEAARAFAWDKVLRSRKVNVNGKVR
jgi:hypothetical protein